MLDLLDYVIDFNNKESLYDKFDIISIMGLSRYEAVSNSARKLNQPGQLSELGRMREDIAEKINFIHFQGPVNLLVPILKPYPENNVNEFLQKLANSSLYEPYGRWQYTRININPLWTKGSGFEGHLVGLPKEKMILILEKFEEEIWWNVLEAPWGSWKKKQELEKFLDNPNETISMKFAFEMAAIFGALLARARAIRSGLQMNNPENRRFYDEVYSQAKGEIILPTWFFDSQRNTFGIMATNSTKGNPVGDIRLKFPALAEIGRFGYPPLRLLLSYFDKKY